LGDVIDFLSDDFDLRAMGIAVAVSSNETEKSHYRISELFVIDAIKCLFQEDYAQHAEFVANCELLNYFKKVRPKCHIQRQFD